MLTSLLMQLVTKWYIGWSDDLLFLQHNLHIYVIYIHTACFAIFAQDLITVHLQTALPAVTLQD